MKRSDTKKMEQILCIYCGNHRSPSEEHVVQKSLGGNLITNLVCKDCNTGFSTIDQRLAESSIFSLARVGNALPESFPAYLGGDNLRVSPEGRWEDVRITNRMKVEILPQIRLEKEPEPVPPRIAFAGSDPDEMRVLISLVDKKIGNGAINKVFIKVGDPIKSKDPRIVLHRHKDLYIRAASQAEGEEFIAVLTRVWSQIYTQVQGSQLKVEPAPPGVVAVEVQVCPDENHRAIAKIAYNLLAVCKGAEYVLQPEFTPLREYIRGNEIVHEPLQGSEDVTVDTRFVQSFPYGPSAFMPSDGHTVVLGYSHPTVFALVTLYSNFTYLVKMADLDLPEFQIEVFEFSIDRTTSRRLDLREVYQRRTTPDIQIR
ncbi:hypothetical protein GETHPA_28450 [Geothrix rubra]|uniref:HNH endonuclease 5 domain-containing protein n=1 Tax=Geothrix rubra TaxID=2927977 RepID=A0ABQ5Q9L4_9BACT|nr:HNH endonuclease [Geothrix rubra]GLH71312.1 hypothetical protein GETHPA_28450 [Geothrix rubra]